MELESLCKSLKCGLCCFIEDEEGYGFGVNKDFELKVFNEVEHPCSKLDIKIIEGVVESMSCRIHESKTFPNICHQQPVCDTCYPLGIKSISYKGNPLKFNKEIKKLVFPYRNL